MKFYDTCALLNAGESAFTERFAIAQQTLEEIENIKGNRNKDEETKFKARQTARLLDENSDNYDVVFQTEDVDNVLDKFHLKETPDNIISATAYVVNQKQPIEFVTDDINVKVSSKKLLQLPTTSFVDHSKLYEGYKVVKMTDDEMAEFYQNKQNVYGLNTNEYMLIQDKNDGIVDTVKWNGEAFTTIGITPFKSVHFGNIKPMDEVQQCAMDSIVSNDITLLYGRAGSGKTLLPLAYAMRELEKGRVSRIYIIYSFEPLKNSKVLGYERGDHITKLLYSGSVGNILATKFGGLDAVEYMMEQNQLDIIPTANIRGIELDENSFVLVTEGQNLETYAIKTLIQRCKIGSKVVIEGDFLEQTDANVSNIGMRRVIDVFKGNPHFGCLKLKYNYRSELGELADLL